jgi:hypothetical protein
MPVAGTATADGRFSLYLIATTEDVRMRIASLVVAGITLALCPSLAFADASVAGDWKADLGGDVRIEMTVSPDGRWSSETAEGDATVAQMAGTYRQKVKSPTSGELTFVPTKSHVTSHHGAPKVEYDTYKLSDSGQVLNLTSGGDTLEFHKHTQ